VLVVLLVLAALALLRGRPTQPGPAIGDGCVVRGPGFAIPLSTDQGSIAADIAGVARHRSMPERAVTIAYAAALQESGLADLAYGDRDSVGVFQQRPSQGWGTRTQLLDPIYATTRFFAALAAVPRYSHLLVYQAAQDVQRSADGLAYDQYAPQGAAMANGFTGYLPHAVWCWYGAGVKDRGRPAAASRDLAAAFGPLPGSRLADPARRPRAPSLLLRVPGQPAGWAVAAWVVTHAAAYGIKAVSFEGYRWTAVHGQLGWIRGSTRRHLAGRPHLAGRAHPDARAHPAAPLLTVTFG